LKNTKKVYIILPEGTNEKKRKEKKEKEKKRKRKKTTKKCVFSDPYLTNLSFQYCIF